MIARTEPKPQPVFCVIEHAHRDRARAEAACDGRFTIAGITLELGVEPDWLRSDLTADEEWRIEWWKFYFGLDLAYAFGLSDDPKFLETWERLVLSWIRQVPVSLDRSDVIGRRIQNWVYAWSQFAATPGFRGLSEGAADTILASLAEQVGHLRAHLTAERNHRTLELYALFVAALALPELPGAADLRDFAARELHRNIMTDIRSDGVHRESSTHYHLIALRTFLAARENSRRFGVRLPDGYDERLRLACEFALHCHRPDGLIPALSDGDTGSYVDLLPLAADLLRRSDFLYAATAGAHGTPPARRNVSFTEGGYFVQRSGWGSAQTPFRQERFLIFDCGPLGDGGHGHYDLLSIEVAAGGRPLLVDPGRYTYSEAPPNWRRWFKGTAAHNTVCVDGLDQTPYHRGKPRGNVAHGRFLGRVGGPGLDVMGGEARSPAYDAVHTRLILFVGDEYWVVADRLRGERPRRYDLRFHLAPEAWGRTTVATEGPNPVVRAPGVALVFARSCDPRIESGWVAPKYGSKLRAPVVSVVVEGRDADFVTLLVPLDPDDPVPALGLFQGQASLTDTTTIQVRGVGRDGARDVIRWSPSLLPAGGGSAPGGSSAVWVRESVVGECLRWTACGVLSTPSAVTSARGTDGRARGGWVSWDPQHGVVRSGDTAT